MLTVAVQDGAATQAMQRLQQRIGGVPAEEAGGTGAVGRGGAGWAGCGGGGRAEVVTEKRQKQGGGG